jgi:hypothetical protein
MNYSTMSISELASHISKDWKNVNFAAKPYLEAMFSLNSINDNYFCDSGKSIVIYFLCNANSWRGEVAKTIKKELKNRTK